ncbi:MotE family protein [Anaerobacillus isosaccharinicus]|uniref:MotE family protein n=2 Tax=Anaerobacillus isosaccharinicus TaxID=1532552 RepID=A0A7S7L4V5_9BACI|nr:MotE family protein [Anaerobacillus isosaccharinicus]MBA5587335.1 MotE family protein [Anaerobacillus isosaccharinicus]QOY34471.1 MotE family protein [Anaerobacillus isosaccharinicus]
MKLGERMKSEEQQYSKIQWFFMVIFIPILFAMILFAVILNFMGISVIDQAKQVASNVPILSDYVKTDEQLLEEEELANIEDLTAVVTAREREIDQLKNSIESKEIEIQSLLEEIKMLMAELEQKQEAQLSVTEDYDGIAKVYVAMSAKNAASILSEMPEEEAAIQLSFIKTDARASILAKMPPEKAAQLISLLSDN